MSRITKRTLSILIGFAVAFTFIPGSFGALESYAASKPAKVTKIKKSEVFRTSVRLSWKKVKGANGYQVVLNGKAVAVTKGTSVTLGGLTAGTKYSAKIRAFKSSKKYYNTKKKKWVKKKPKASQWKTKKVRTKNTYGKFSKAFAFKTMAPPANINYPSLEQARSQTLATINAYRKKWGATGDLALDDTANRVAQKRAEYMASTGRVGDYFPEMGGTAWELMDAQGKELWNLCNVYAPNITSFDSSIVKKTDKAKYHGYMEASFLWAEEEVDDYNAIGIGYCKGYLDIVFVQYPYEY